MDGQTFAVLETPLNSMLRNNTKVPRTPDYGAPAGHEITRGEPHPFTGHALTADLDGHATREFYAIPTGMQPGSVMRFKKADGSERVLQMGELSGHTWVLRQIDPVDPSFGFFWEPLP